MTTIKVTNIQRPGVVSPKSVTLRNAVSFTRLDQLLDVTESNPQDGDVLVYNASTDKYVVQTLTLSSNNITDLDGGTF